MSIKGFGAPEHMDDPEERKAPDIYRREADPLKFKEKSKSSLSIKSVRTTTAVFVGGFWIVFLALLAFGIFRALGAYTGS